METWAVGTEECSAARVEQKNEQYKGAKKWRAPPLDKESPIQAISHFVEHMVYEIPQPEFRKLVGPKSSLAKAIKGLIRHLPQDGGGAPFEQMRALFCYGDAELDGLDTETQKSEVIWDQKYSSATVSAALKQWLDLMDVLHRQTGTGAPMKAAQRDFVEELAAYWVDDLGAPLGSSRNEAQSSKPGGELDEHGQRGLFAQFVHCVARGIPSSVIPKDRNGNPCLHWDHAIREISEKKS